MTKSAGSERRGMAGADLCARAKRASVKQFCRQHDLTEQSFYYWRKRLQRPASMRFALVEAEPWRGTADHGALELVLATGERLRIGAGRAGRCFGYRHATSTGTGSPIVQGASLPMAEVRPNHTRKASGCSGRPVWRNSASIGPKDQGYCTCSSLPAWNSSAPVAGHSSRKSPASQ